MNMAKKYATYIRGGVLKLSVQELNSYYENPFLMIMS